MRIAEITESSGPHDQISAITSDLGDPGDPGDASRNFFQPPAVSVIEIGNPRC
jgi:hypothetical protein